jgi:hypothetical protein
MEGKLYNLIASEIIKLSRQDEQNTAWTAKQFVFYSRKG